MHAPIPDDLLTQLYTAQDDVIRALQDLPPVKPEIQIAFNALNTYIKILTTIVFDKQRNKE